MIDLSMKSHCQHSPGGGQVSVTVTALLINEEMMNSGAQGANIEWEWECYSERPFTEDDH